MPAQKNYQEGSIIMIQILLNSKLNQRAKNSFVNVDSNNLSGRMHVHDAAITFFQVLRVIDVWKTP